MMLKRVSTLALTLALATPLSTAKAIGTQSYDVCGGSYGGFVGFAFCASVQLAVTNVSAGVYKVALTVANMSGTNGSFGGSIFQNIGVDNILGNLANPANVLVTQDGATVCSNLNNDQTGSAGCWNVKVDQSSAGGVNIDFLANTSAGNNLALSSACSGGSTLDTCLNLHPVTISFYIDTDFNPATSGDIYIKGQGMQQSTECFAGPTASSPTCSRVTATPEPATLGLMSTGLITLVPFFRRRRKTDESIES
jgi:hypothetical protein